MAQGTAARQAAFRILRGVRAGQPFNVAQLAAVTGLSDSDRRLAHEIAAGVLRGRTELDRRLRPLVSRDWDSTESDLKDLLRIGTYQLTQLNRVPAYAAVQATVEVAKEVKGPRGAGLINAVLRRVSQDRSESPQPGQVWDAKGLAAEYSHPTWLVERWTRQFGLERTRALLEHNNRRPGLVIQPVGWSLERLRNQLRAEGVSFAAAPGGAGLTVERSRVERLPGYAAGGFIVQDAAQALLLEYAKIPEDALVWDACAAPGGKTAVLSRGRRVVASELKRDRMVRLRETLARTAPGVSVFVADARYPPLAPMTVDVAVIDAPCSATGTIGRHPDGRWRITERSIAGMAARQVALLDGAWTTVRPGGLIVYLTCSLEPEEDGEQVDLFLERHRSFERDRDDLLLFPPDTGTDGGFGACMRRVR